MAFTLTTINALTAETDIADNDRFPMNDVSVGTTETNHVTYLTLIAFDVDLVVASGSITIKPRQLITLNLGTAIALTVSNAPAAGYEIAIYRKGSGAVTHTVQLPSGVFWEGSNRTANFNGDADVIYAVAESATRFIVLSNTSVTFSA